MTTWELTWGASGVVEPAQRRVFKTWHGNDAVTCFAERVIELDRDTRVSAGWVHLTQHDPDRLVAAWTKTSDERPTEEGEA